MGKRRRKSPDRPPQAGAEGVHEGEAGPLEYAYSMPPVKSRGRLIPLFDWAEPAPTTADGPSRLVPASEEVAKLPRFAREAFAARCAERVAPLRAGAKTPEVAAALILAAATVETPIRKQLLCIRRDFDLIAQLAKAGNWTDDTPVPPDAFGPLWPKNLAPTWAAPQPPAEGSDSPPT